MYEVKLTYFRDTGKYYASGHCLITEVDLGRIWDEVRRLNREGRLPGLVAGSSNWNILVEVPKHPHNHPRLIMGNV